jgi:hypothetical protein
MKIERLLIGTAAALLCASASAQAWDAANNWSTPSNPNGVWSYGEFNSSNTFIPLVYDPTKTEYDWNYSALDGAQIWENPNSYAEQGIGAGQISLNSAYGTGVVRFTAPTTADYSFDIQIGGSEASEFGGSGNVLAQYGTVAVNGTAEARSSFIDNLGIWTFSAPLTAGDTVDAYVIANGTSASTDTALTFGVNAVPEPASYVVLSLGALGFLIRRKRA